MATANAEERQEEVYIEPLFSKEWVAATEKESRGDSFMLRQSMTSKL